MLLTFQNVSGNNQPDVIMTLNMSNKLLKICEGNSLFLCKMLERRVMMD